MYKVLFATIAAAVISGCANTEFAETIDALRDDSFSVGCVTDEIRARGGLGVWGQSGDMEGSICKLKCSPNLPPGYCFEYSNPATGCKAKAGTGCDGNAPQEVIIVEPKINNNSDNFEQFGKAPDNF